MPEGATFNKPFVVIGEEDVISGFQALGFRVYAVKENETDETVLAEALAPDTAICLVQDNIYQSAKEEIDKYRTLPLPVFIPFGKDAGMSLLESLVKDVRLRAIGTF